MTDSESIKGNFPFPIFPHHHGLPDYSIVNQVHTKGKANASSITSELGGGRTASLALLCPLQLFSNLRATISYDPQIPVLFRKTLLDRQPKWLKRYGNTKSS